MPANAVKLAQVQAELDAFLEERPVIDWAAWRFYDALAGRVGIQRAEGRYTSTDAWRRFQHQVLTCLRRAVADGRLTEYSKSGRRSDPAFRTQAAVKAEQVRKEEAEKLAEKTASRTREVRSRLKRLGLAPIGTGPVLILDDWEKLLDLAEKPTTIIDSLSGLQEEMTRQIGEHCPDCTDRCTLWPSCRMQSA